MFLISIEATVNAHFFTFYYDLSQYTFKNTLLIKFFLFPHAFFFTHTLVFPSAEIFQTYTTTMRGQQALVPIGITN